MGLMKSLAGGSRGGGGMAPSITIRVDPGDEKRLIRKLDRLPDKIFKRVVGAAASFAVTPVVKAAQSKAPKRTGRLAESIGKRRRQYNRAGVVIVVVGPRKGFVDPQTGEDPAKIGHLVEFGTAPHTIPGAVVNIDGRMVPATVHHPGARGKPFLKPALHEQAQAVLVRYRSKLWKGIVKYAKGR